MKTQVLAIHVYMCIYQTLAVFQTLMTAFFNSITSVSDVVSVSCFGVIFSVMFHFMFVHYTFSSVWVAEWPPFGK